ncbi:MAG: agmatinase family protein [Deltaproteobacteria bacterium]|nr:agmatinase family protein [Deltaproteobacteria bacterium]
MTANFDPNAPAGEDAGLYGLPHTVDEAHVVVVPVPFEATVSYREGTARGPQAILLASHQVDLFDADVGRPYERGIAMLEVPAWMADLNEEARGAALAVIDAQIEGETPDEKEVAVVDAAGERVNAWVQERVTWILEQGKLPVVVGGDHSVPFGAIAACARKLGDKPLGVLHLDAHCDLREAYEGFQWSHASIMKNVLDRIPTTKLVQLGIRDFGDAELDVVRAHPERIVTYFDVQLREARLEGTFRALADRIVENLPPDVYLSFDVDGLDPALCPSTGTPVPGGLSFDEILAVLAALVASGRRVIGLDLVEVAPPDDLDDDQLGDCFDANVGARLLYKMIGTALLSRGEGRTPDLPIPPGI